MNAGPTLREVRSGGIALAVREHSAHGPGKQHVVLVHGYPDQQDVWDPVVAALPHDRLHVVTYDVRGAGASDAPDDTAGYRTERLVEDLAAVVGSVVPDGEAVHLVGHDWGSVQLWDAVDDARTDPRLAGRVASFTSISGPSLDHVARISAGRAGLGLRALRQRLHSWYVFVFLLPRLPELLWRRFHRQAAWVVARSEGRDSAHFGASLPANAINGLGLYRANVLPRLRAGGRLSTRVPVLVVHPTRDLYITGFVHERLAESCADVRRVDVPAGHWVVRTEPGLVAALVVEHVSRHAPDRPANRPA
jgi:pimeloyl-ACP methyl ester carboxylesterase